MTPHLLTLDFHNASLALREQAAFSEHALPGALAALHERGAREAAILSTCNRVEVLALFPDARDAGGALLAFLSEWHRLPTATLAQHCVCLSGEAAARHLIRVACGLESLVPGEMQILGQVKQAAQQAREAGLLGPQLHALFTGALRAGRRARHETDIARRPVSISHAAVTLIQQHFGNDLSGRRVLLIGSGKMGEVAAQQLHKAGAAHVIVANRTLAHACELAQRWEGTALPLDEMPDALAQVDAVISATSAPHFILRPAQIEPILAQRAGRTLLLVDLAVPRDIDPAVAALPGVLLRDVDGLQEVVAQNIRLRNEEREQVERIVQEELDKFWSEQAIRAVVPTIVSLRRSAEAIRQAEVDKALSRLSTLSAEQRAVVEALSRGLMNKFLHEPTLCLREKATTESAAHFQQTVTELFALPEEPL